MKNLLVTILKSICVVSAAVFMFLPLIYTVVQLLLLVIKIPEDVTLPYFLSAEGFFRFLYTSLILAIWYKLLDKPILLELLGIFMSITFCCPSLLKNIFDCLLTGFLVGVGILFLVLCLMAIANSSTPESMARLKADIEARDEKWKKQSEEFMKSSKPNYEFEYAVDRGMFVEYCKRDMNNPSRSVRSSFRGSLVSYSTKTVTVLDNGFYVIYYADGQRRSKPATKYS